MVPMRDADSGDLLLVAAGELNALDRIIDRWKKAVYACFERALEPSAATEAASEVFFRLYRTASRYDPATPFPVWIMGLTARALQERPAEPVPSIPMQRLRESGAARAALLRSVVLSIPGKERAAFLLTRVARMPLPQAAAAMGVSEEEIRRLLVRAFEGLASGLGPVLDEPELLGILGQPARVPAPDGGAA